MTDKHETAEPSPSVQLFVYPNQIRNRIKSSTDSLRNRNGNGFFKSCVFQLHSSKSRYEKIMGAKT